MERHGSNDGRKAFRCLGNLKADIRHLCYGHGRQAIDIQIRHLEELHRQKLEMTRALRTLGKTDRFREPLRLIMTVPGFGQAAGMAFLSEICDITRFRNAEQLAAYIGMIPMCHASGEKDGTGDITVRKHAVMRCNLIEATWVAVRQDPAMNLFFTEQCKRMPKSKTIVADASCKRQAVQRICCHLSERERLLRSLSAKRQGRAMPLRRGLFR